ncbi:uncharacterized protein LOC118439769 isoform X1 [Vespa mandarinia]|uniref:uncharacterized protein LOC118439769 isoform X1 n=1 Tax=Vespa mandarinia TaxID=7446 RepID=UPI00160FCBC8|nr:uncharacterized protein LOC118439769 isoform X1 [Vespa mandarinia]XP_035717877.1 uncharacterized protein LOC118439769 isoform X1 [Vespa mandarinia]
MTGSTSSEGLRPQETSPIPTRDTLFSHDSFVEERSQHHQPRRKMTPLPPSGTPIQLTPLWEHVVRTRRFPSEIDTRLIFVEISERLRDPEWEVRQHALRVLMDVMPTLSSEIVDEVMQPVVPELLNNLGHAAPAVRKGALDALRVYLVHSLDRERIVKNIFRDGFNRRDVQDVFQTNLITGVILSAPSLLFPSSSGSRPSKDIVKYVTFSLASRLTQVAYQEAILKSLMKIREIIGVGEFDDIISGCDGELKKHLEVLCKVYNVKPSKKSQTKISLDRKEVNKLDDEVGNPTCEKIWDSDSDTSGIAEEDDEIVNGTMPPARVVLETEIKFNEETAITMTILEEKAMNSEEDEEGEESGTDVRNETEITSEHNDRRKKTPRRVHFGGEIVKLRTPDSDDTESVVVASSKTRIPLPVSPATKMPSERPRRKSISQPNSPHFARRNTNRMSRSLSSSPKREVYTHNADLSPKKGILMRTNSPLFVIEPIDRHYNDNRDKRNDKSIEMSSRSGSPKLNNNDDESSRSIVRVNTIEEHFNIEELPDDIKNENDHRKDKEDSKNVKEDKRLFRSFSVPSMRLIESNYESKDLQRIKFIKEQDKNLSFSNNTEEHFSINNQANVIEHDKSVNDTKINNRAISTNESNHENLDDERSLDVTSKIDEKMKDNVGIGTTSGLKSNERESTNVLRKIHSSKTFKRERDSRSPTKIVDFENIVTSRKYNESEEIRRTKTIHGVGNENLTRAGDGKNEGKSQEPSWEELGLVNHEVLDDLHNKEDWRARVRGLERVASALRTPSALIAIESRLGSLLHAVLGGERSCRVAAAGLSVAKVVVAGVTEDALKRKLPQLAWGLARQGGPSAAQLARIAMLRLKPAYLLEQFLQPQCLGARNAKTRENALQLLIFSFVTFPSTEFKVETVAHKVALMVGDRRRRVRQAALDALAVLAQIYEPEEVLRAGKRASANRHDGEAMFSAIRSRLARKSLPLVSADGLVVYGLQISPTVQIATGPDVDWIVAGSGSVSPGTGRSKRQISTAKPDKGNFLRNKNAKKYGSPWTNRQNLFAHGIALRPTNEKPVVWQILSQNQDDTFSCSNEVQGLEERIDDIVNDNDGHSRTNRNNHNTTTSSKGTTINLNRRETTEINIDDNGNVRSIAKENVNLQDDRVGRPLSQETSAIKQESKIPIFFSRGMTSTKINDQHSNILSDNSFDQVNVKLRKKIVYNSENKNSGFKLRSKNIGLETTYQRRKRLQQDATISPMNLFDNQVTNQTSDSRNNTYRPLSCTINSKYTVEGQKNILDKQNITSKVVSQDHPSKVLVNKRYSRSSDGYSRFSRPSSVERPHPISETDQQSKLSAFQTSNSVYQRQKQFVTGPSFKTLKTVNTSYSRTYQDVENSNEETLIDNTSFGQEVSFQPRIDRRINEATSQQLIEPEEISSSTRTDDDMFVNSPFRRRIRSLSPSQLYHQEQFVGTAFKDLQAASMYDIDKAPVNVEEYNDRKSKDYYLSETNIYPIQALNNEESFHQDYERKTRRIRSADSTSSDLSASDSNERRRNQPTLRSLLEDRDRDESDNNSIGMSISQSENNEKAFDVISDKSQGRDPVDSYVLTMKESDASTESTSTSAEDETSKDWSSEERIKSRNKKTSKREKLVKNDNDSILNSESSDTVDRAKNKTELRRKSIVTIISDEDILMNELLVSSGESLEINYRIDRRLHDTPTISSPEYTKIITKSDSEYINSMVCNDYLNVFGSPRRDLRNVHLTSNFDKEVNEILQDVSEEVPSVFLDQSVTHQTLETKKPDRLDDVIESAASLLNKPPEYIDNSRNIETRMDWSVTEDTTEENATNMAFTKIPVSSESFTKLNDIRDEHIENNEASAILKIEPQSEENTEVVRKMSSRVLRSSTKSRNISNKSNMNQHSEKGIDKQKPIVRQCFNQLENEDWEVTIKGLKSLSQLAKQHPEYLDLNIGGTIGRLLGRHIKNLRSQVARAACIAAGDIFSCQIRGIDQDIDDIVGPLLHRTADTNRFLRADSNTALDRMVESLPPHKTIGIIVYRGVSHQNAIVRAATARLLLSIVDRIGAEHAMILPRDVRNKLLGSGAKLLMDGNLDARNNAKKIFRRLMNCEGFQKALTDAVPETTLRHIDKTLKSL